MSAQPFAVKIDDKETLQLLYDNLHNLEHPAGWIKHPYFDERFAANPDGVREVKKRFCEALVLLLEKHDRLKKRPGRSRKADNADA
jgi:hypothetical protein